MRTIPNNFINEDNIEEEPETLIQDEEPEALIQDTNLIGLSPIGREASRTHRDLLEEVVERKLDDGKIWGKAKRGPVIPRNPVKITEVDLVSDPEDEGEKPGTGGEQTGTSSLLGQGGITIEVKIQNGGGTSSTTIQVSSKATKTKGKSRSGPRPDRVPNNF